MGYYCFRWDIVAARRKAVKLQKERVQSRCNTAVLVVMPSFETTPPSHTQESAYVKTATSVEVAVFTYVPKTKFASCRFPAVVFQFDPNPIQQFGNLPTVKADVQCTVVPHSPSAFLLRSCPAHIPDFFVSLTCENQSIGGSAFGQPPLFLK